MSTVYDYDAKKWLTIPDSKAKEIFGETADAIRVVYRKLAQRWHPDRNTSPDAVEVFVRIQKLHRIATGEDSVDSTNSLNLSECEIVDASGKRFSFKGQSFERFELGFFYRGKGSFAYKVEKNHKEFFNKAVSIIKNFNFANEDMKKAMLPCLPEIAGHPLGEDGGLLVIKKNVESVRLRDLFNYILKTDKAMDARHVAWVLSGLFNISCYLEYSDLAHQAISLDSVWVTPRTHDVSLLGGWFFAQNFNQPIKVLPSYSASLASSKYLKNKIAEKGFDRELIRAVGRELLGDRTGQRLKSYGVPDPIINFLLDIPAKTAVEDYKNWKECLRKVFGDPKFIKMEISHHQVY